MTVRLSLKYRIAAIIFVLESIMMGFVLWQTLGQSIEASRAQLAANEQAMLDIASGIGRIALLTEEYADLQPYLEGILKDPRVIRVLLANTQGLVVASTYPSDVGSPAQPLFGTAQSDNRFWRSLELNNAAGTLGLLAIEFSNQALLKAHAEARNLGLSIALVGMSIIAVIGVLAGLFLTRRLERLTQAAQSISHGRPAAPLMLRGHDELAQLGRSFDEMTQRLQEEKEKTLAARAELEHKVEERTADLAAANRELETFSYSVSHDLRAPLRSLDGFSQALLEDCVDKLNDTEKDYLKRIRAGAQRMASLIDALLSLSRITRQGLEMRDVDLSELARLIIGQLPQSEPGHQPEISIQPDMHQRGDAGLLEALLLNLLGNAWKFTRGTPQPLIRFERMERDGRPVYVIRDNGAGFDMRHADKLFGAFQRLHQVEEFEGTGIGLATVQRIVHRHGGRIWAEAKPGEGASFYFTLAGD